MTVNSYGLRPTERRSNRDPSQYGVVKFVSKNVGNRVVANPDPYPFSGDHIYINTISGSGHIQIKLDSFDNPWIDVYEGFTISREFKRFYIRDVGHNSTLFPTTSAVVYYSYGPLVIPAPKGYGIRGGFSTWLLQATNMAYTRFSEINSVFVETNNYYFQGGSVLIKNTDSVSTLYLLNHSSLVNAFPYVPALPDIGFPISPGESLSFDVESRLGKNPGTNANTNHDAAVITDAATCNFAIMFSNNTPLRTDVDLPNYSGEAL